MGDKIKELIESVDKRTRTYTELDYLNEVLRNENIGLKLKIEEQEKIIRKQSADISSYQDIPDYDLQVLKDMFISQKSELREKDEQLHILREVVEKLSNDLEYNLEKRDREFQLCDIPGIGMKTESKLVTAGIQTPHHLKLCNPNEKAAEINGISANRIKKWQKYVISRETSHI